MENSVDILSSLLQNPETLNLIAGIAKSFLSANVSMAKNTENQPPVNQSTEQSENTVQETARNTDNMDFSGENSVSDNSGANQSAGGNPEALNAAVNAIKMLGGSNGHAPSQSKAAVPPINASAVIDAPEAHNSFDERANLLRSIKPYLKDDRQQKVDSLVKALNIAKLINSYTGSSGLLGK